MAWRCSSSSQHGLVDNLKLAGIITNPNVYQAMLAVDRGNYAPANPYEDAPQPIGYHATISAPHMHAYALEYLSHNIMIKDAKILDVGCGSGYFAALCARMNPSSEVTAIDYIPELVSLSHTNIMKTDSDLLDSGRLILKCESGWKEPEEGEVSYFDVIHVGAAADTLPASLIKKLKVGGRMIIPVGPRNGDQELLQVDKVANEGRMDDVIVRTLLGVRYVPLVQSS